MIKELLRDKGLWIAVLITAIGMLTGIPFYEMKVPLETGSFIDYFQTAVSSKQLFFLMPVVSVLPMGAVYIRDRASGFLKLYITRTSRKEYIRRKILQIYVSGFLIFLFAGMMILAFSFLFLFPLELKGKWQGEDFMEVLKMFFRVTLVGGIIAEISGIFAGVFQNYYMAYGLPFVCYYILIILKERYLPEMYSMYPIEWIQCEQDWGKNGSGIWFFLLLFSIMTVLMNGLVLYHRLREI